jgi:flagellar basal body P-ring formation protein FlgA
MARPLLAMLRMRISSKYRRLALSVWFGGTVLTARPSLSSVDAPAELQDNVQLEAIARSEASLHLPALTAHERFVAGPISTSTRLGRCSQPVKPSVGSGGQMRDRILVELRCPGTPPWHIYVPVRVVGTSQVTIAAHAIVAGSVLTESDVRTEQRDISELPPGYMDDPAVTMGLTAGRPISSGAVITNQLLLGTKAVQRGQTVTLVAGVGGMSVSMQGRALTDGLVNQRVKVENLSSGKVVEGIARSQQVVEIILQ